MPIRRLATLAFVFSVVANGTAFAQVVNPATVQTAPPAPQGQTVIMPGTHTWEMPAIEVKGKAPLTEEDKIGAYEQPRWTSHRRFGETRVYVIPQGEAEFEFWLLPEMPKGNEPATLGAQYEFEFGLPGRFQVDLYAVSHKTGQQGPMEFDEQKYEVRWALADWGKIWGNPALYAEWKAESNAPDHFEGKLLLGGEITSRWHWGSNLVYEYTMGGDKELSREWTTGLSYTVADTKASIGLESQLALVNSVDAKGVRGDATTEFNLGPSVQFRPLPRVHIDVAPLFGLTKNALRMKGMFVFGWEF